MKTQVVIERRKVPLTVQTQPNHPFGSSLTNSSYDDEIQQVNLGVDIAYIKTPLISNTIRAKVKHGNNIIELSLFDINHDLAKKLVQRAANLLIKELSDYHKKKGKK